MDYSTSNQHPKVLLITERYGSDLGGVAKSARRIAMLMAGLSCEIHVFSWTKTLPAGELKSETESIMDEHGQATIELSIHRLGMFANWDFTFQYTFNVLEWLHEQFQFSCVWGHYLFPAGFSAVMFAELMRIPSTVSARGNDIDRLMFPPGDFSRLLWTLERTTVVSAVSHELSKKIDTLLGRDRKVVVLPNVVDTNVFKPAESDLATRQHRKIWGINESDTVLGFCGELRHKKGLPFLLRAFREVFQQRECRLFVIGEVRLREQMLVSGFLSEHPELATRLHITGHLQQAEQVANALQICDVVLQPSLWDGMPNAVLEAMACEKLVIASDAGGIAEVVRHGENGFLIPKHELFRLGEAVTEVLDLPAADKMLITQAARRTCQQGLESGAQQTILARILRQLLNSD